MELTEAQTRSQRIALALKLAWPVILENLLVSTVSMADTAMVGALGSQATSAVALTASPTWVLNAMVMSANVGCSVLVARRVGAKDWEGARSGARQTLVLGILFGAAFCLIMELLSGRIPVWMGGEADVIPQAVSYLRIVALGYPTYYMGLILGGAIRGAGDMSTPMRITALTNILNIIGNYFLIYPSRTLHLGDVSIPMWGAGLGVDGAAISTAVSTGLSGIILLVLLFRRKSGLYLRRGESYRLIGADMREVFYVGIPTAIERVTINLGQVFFIRIVSSLGTVQLAAHHLAVTAESISYNPGFGFASAGTTLVGQSLGAKNEKLAQSYGWITIWSSFLVMLLCGTILFVFARPFIGLFTPDEEVAAWRCASWPSPSRFSAWRWPAPVCCAARGTPRSPSPSPSSACGSSG